jgi:hypothetical protein
MHHMPFHPCPSDFNPPRHHTPLLPVLLASSLMHVGRHVENGNGVFSIYALLWPSNGLAWR